jgi:hypothetical protein
MQTAKIKLNEAYAYRRGGEMFRFQAEAIVTRKNSSGTESMVEGYVIEDHKPGEKINRFSVEPRDLHGPYAEHEALRERNRKEAEAKKVRDAERNTKALQDRLALYAFVGVTPPKDVTEYRQLFRVSYGSLDMSNDGQAKIVDVVNALQAANVSTAGIVKKVTDAVF